MKIIRTFAPTMREALALVKQQQGADAVILGNNKVAGGIEILSAIDFDEASIASMSHTNSTKQPLPSNTATAIQSVDELSKTIQKNMALQQSAWEDRVLQTSEDGRREPVLNVLKAEARNPVTRKTSKKSRLSTQSLSNKQNLTVKDNRKIEKNDPQHVEKMLGSLRQLEFKQQPVKPTVVKAEPDPVIGEVKNELKHLRGLMQSQLSVLEWDQQSRRHPVRTVLLNLMTEMGLGADICEMLFDQLPDMEQNPQKIWQMMLARLAQILPIAKNDILAQGGRIALVGSTGVGKTTTLAKLAARFVHNHGKRSVALVSTDHFRIGAREQLQHYARLLEVPLLSANNSEELGDHMDMLSDKKLVLIDTAGMSQNDIRLSEQFHTLQKGSPEIRPYLVLSANTQLSVLNQIVKSFDKVQLAGAYVTKIDEAASLGGILTTAIRHQLPLAYCGIGQKVPKDLERAKNHRLVSKAVTLMQTYSEQIDGETMAMRYSHILNKSRA